MHFSLRKRISQKFCIVRNILCIVLAVHRTHCYCYYYRGFPVTFQGYKTEGDALKPIMTSPGVTWSHLESREQGADSPGGGGRGGSEGGCEWPAREALDTLCVGCWSLETQDLSRTCPGPVQDPLPHNHPPGSRRLIRRCAVAAPSLSLSLSLRSRSELCRVESGMSPARQQQQPALVLVHHFTFSSEAVARSLSARSSLRNLSSNHSSKVVPFVSPGGAGRAGPGRGRRAESLSFC